MTLQTTVEKQIARNKPLNAIPAVPAESQVAAGVEEVRLQRAMAEEGHKATLEQLRQKELDVLALQQPLSNLLQKLLQFDETTERIKRNLALQEKLSAEYREFLNTLLCSPLDTDGQPLYKIGLHHPGYIFADGFIVEIKRILKARELQQAELHAQIKACLNDRRRHFVYLLPAELAAIVDK